MHGGFVLALLLAACGRVAFSPLPDAGHSRPLRGYMLDGGAASARIRIVEVGADGALAASQLPAFDAGVPLVFVLGAASTLYATTTDQRLLAFAVDVTTGALTPIDSEAVGSQPWWLALHPKGRWLYASNWSVAQRLLYGFAVADDGSLTPLSGSPWSLPFDAISVDIHPGGQWLAASSDDDMIHVLAIGASGELSDTGSRST